jgi:protein involved in polysaccharide export with SLBB domain
MKGKKILFFAVFLMWAYVPLFSASPVTNQPVGLVVRSPLYGSETTGTAVDIIPFGTFSEQLGLSTTVQTFSGTATELQQRILMAVSDVSYPITPGDTFRLSYTDSVNRIVTDLQVDSNYTVDIPAMGTIDAKGMTLPQLKEKIFALVGTYFAFSNPQLTMTGTGSFFVTVKGEVNSTGSYPAWGLSRLSSVVSDATNFASSRDVVVKSLDGTERQYDLYRALRKGDLTQDPLLKAGDVVTVGRADRIVTLSGRVFRPGTYQLLSGENLKDLVTTYGGGLMPGADIQRIRVQRFDNDISQWNAEYVDLLQSDSSLVSYDQVVVDSIEQTTGSVTVEGAIRSDEAYDATTSTAIAGQASGRIFYQFYPGETLQQMVRSLQVRLMTSSDYEHASFIRNGKKQMLNLRGMLSGTDATEPLVLQTNDQLIIPFAQRFVTVTGAVTRPGTYAYVPDKTADYYIALAGGVTTDAYKPISVSVTDGSGNKMRSDSIVGKEYSVKVKENTFVKDLAPTVAVIGLVSSVLSILYYSILTYKGVSSLE